MSRKNFYFGEVVTEDELDAAFTYVEQSDFQLAVDADIAAVEKTGTPDCTVKGGILSGGVVTKNSPTSLSITALRVRDDAGVRVVIPTATVALTKTGDTAAADTTLAEGDGALIAIAGGNEAWVTVWAAFDEVLSDPRTDATGATVYFDVADSFHFHLDMGAQGLLNACVARAALQNDMVLLADVLLDDSEEIRAVGGPDSICSSNANFVAMGGAYIAMTGRRGDWLALDSTANFPRYAALGISLRAAGPREALIQLASELQRSGASPGGTKHLGQEALAGSALSPSPAFSALSLSAGSLFTALSDMIVKINTKLSRGGGVLQPDATSSGLDGDPTYMHNDKALIALQAKTAAGIAPSLRLGKKYGHICLPNLYHENFTYQGTNVAGRTVYAPGPDSHWSKSLLGAASEVYLRNSNDGAPYGIGIAELTADVASGDFASLFFGYEPAANFWNACWDLSQAPFAACSFRFQIPAFTDLQVRAAFNFALAFCWLQISVVAGQPTLTITLDNGAGAVATASVNTVYGVPALLANTWYTARMAITSDHTAVAEMCGPGMGNGEQEVDIGPAAMPSGPYLFALQASNVVPVGPTGGVLRCRVDWVQLAEAQLASDMQ